MAIDYAALIGCVGVYFSVFVILRFNGYDVAQKCSKPRAVNSRGCSSCAASGALHGSAYSVHRDADALSNLHVAERAVVRTSRWRAILRTAEDPRLLDVRRHGHTRRSLKANLEGTLLAVVTTSAALAAEAPATVEAIVRFRAVVTELCRCLVDNCRIFHSLG